MSKKKAISRRSFMRMISGSAAGLIFSSLVSPDASAQTGLTDNDANDEVGYGRRGRSGLTDSDANDEIGYGRRGRSGVTDSDANDEVGYGRGSR